MDDNQFDVSSICDTLQTFHKDALLNALNDEKSAHECIGSFSELDYNDFVSSTLDVIPFHFLLIQNLEEGQEHQHVLHPADDKNYYVS